MLMDTPILKYVTPNPGGVWCCLFEWMGVCKSNHRITQVDSPMCFESTDRPVAEASRGRAGSSRSSPRSRTSHSSQSRWEMCHQRAALVRSGGHRDEKLFSGRLRDTTILSVLTRSAAPASRAMTGGFRHINACRRRDMR